MKITLIIARSLMGLMFLFSSITFLFKLITPPEPSGTVKVFNDGLEASIYLLPTAKIIELICGIAFLSGMFVPLALILIAPILVNIVLIHVFLAPEGLPLAIVLALIYLFVAYSQRERFKPLFKI